MKSWTAIGLGISISLTMITFKQACAEEYCSPADPTRALSTDPKKEAPVWDLSFVYRDLIDDERIELDAKEALERAKAFRQKYEGKILGKHLAAEELVVAIQSLEEIQNQILRPLLFLDKLLSVNKDNAQAEALSGKIRTSYAAFSATVTFFGLELSRTEEAYLTKLLDTGHLENYRQYLIDIRLNAEYMLTKSEEELLSQLSPLFSAMSDLREDFETGFVFKFQGPTDDVPRDYTGPELMQFVHHPDQKIREDAKELFLQRYHEFRNFFAKIYTNVIRQGLIVKENLRKYDSVMQSRNISNGLEDDVVDALLETTRKNFGLAQRYWKAKQRLLGLSTFSNTDIYAPYTEGTDGNVKISWTEGMAMVLEAYGKLSPEFARIFKEECLAKNKVHARTQKGKRGGAYMSPLVTDTGPVWFMNWTGDMSSVKTAAHEGGHWMHSFFSLEQTPHNYNVDMVRAETASTLGEILVTDLLMKRFGQDPKAKLGLLVKNVDELFATIYRQSTFAMFERDAFKEVRDHGAASADRLEALFTKHYGALFGDAASQTPHFKAEWSYIPHFVNSPYYVYAYAAANLAVIAIYKQWTENPQGFGPKIIQFLKRGGSVSTKEAYAELGIDVSDPKFWQKGFDYLNDLVTEVEKLVDQI
jgi:oligoendopeptidase F